MSTPEQYRAQAVEYSRLVKIAKSPTEVREFQNSNAPSPNSQTTRNGRSTITTNLCMPRAVPLVQANRRSEALQRRRKQQLVASVRGACRL